MDEEAIRAASAAYEAARAREQSLAMVNIAMMDEAETARVRGDYAVAQAITQQCWVALRKAQGFAT